MIGIDISTLSPGELQRLSQVAQARGQTALADALTLELRERPGRAAGRRPGPISLPTPTVAPIVPVRARQARSRRRGVSRWALAGVAIVALMLGWGVTLPSSRILEAHISASPALALVEAPVANALCTASSVLGGADTCDAPVPLADMEPGPDVAPAT